jgi:hypothetical protein
MSNRRSGLRDRVKHRAKKTKSTDSERSSSIVSARFIGRVVNGPPDESLPLEERERCVKLLYNQRARLTTSGRRPEIDLSTGTRAVWFAGRARVLSQTT